jgi:hypothetical protein
VPNRFERPISASKQVQAEVLVGLSTCGMSREDFVEWAKLKGIANPLSVAKSLLDLDVIVLSTKDGIPSFFLR